MPELPPDVARLLAVVEAADSQEPPQPSVPAADAVRAAVQAAVEQVDLDEKYGELAGPKKVKPHEKNPDGTVRTNPLLYRLDDFPLEVLLSRRHAHWHYAVDAAGEIFIGTEEIRTVLDQAEWIARFRAERPEQSYLSGEELDTALQGFKAYLDKQGHPTILAGGRPGRVAGELMWRQVGDDWQLQINDKSGRYMSQGVRPDLTAKDSAEWVGNVAARMSERFGVPVHAVPYKFADKPAASATAQTRDNPASDHESMPWAVNQDTDLDREYGQLWGPRHVKPGEVDAQGRPRVNPVLYRLGDFPPNLVLDRPEAVWDYAVDADGEIWIGSATLHTVLDEDEWRGWFRNVHPELVHLEGRDYDDALAEFKASYKDSSGHTTIVMRWDQAGLPELTSARVAGELLWKEVDGEWRVVVNDKSGRYMRKRPGLTAEDGLRWVENVAERMSVRFGVPVGVAPLKYGADAKPAQAEQPAREPAAPAAPTALTAAPTEVRDVAPPAPSSSRLASAEVTAVDALASGSETSGRLATHQLSGLLGRNVTVGREPDGVRTVEDVAGVTADPGEQQILRAWMSGDLRHHFEADRWLAKALRDAKPWYQNPQNRPGLFKKENLLFLTQAEGREPTLYFEQGDKGGRIRQQHPRGPRVFHGKASEHYFFESEQAMRRFAAGASLAQSGVVPFDAAAVANLSQMPQTGSRHVEVVRGEDGRPVSVHKSQGRVVTDLDGYDDERITEIFLKAVGLPPSTAPRAGRGPAAVAGAGTAPHVAGAIDLPLTGMYVAGTGAAMVLGGEPLSAGEAEAFVSGLRDAFAGGADSSGADVDVRAFVAGVYVGGDGPVVVGPGGRRELTPRLFRQLLLERGWEPGRSVVVGYDFEDVAVSELTGELVGWLRQVAREIDAPVYAPVSVVDGRATPVSAALPRGVLGSGALFAPGGGRLRVVGDSVVVPGSSWLRLLPGASAEGRPAEGVRPDGWPVGTSMVLLAHEAVAQRSDVSLTEAEFAGWADTAFDVVARANGGAVPAQYCVPLLEALLGQLYPQGITAVQASGTSDDLVLPGAGAVSRLAPGAKPLRVPSWARLQQELERMGVGATAIVFAENPYIIGDVFAGHVTSDGGVRWTALPDAVPRARVRDTVPHISAAGASVVLVDRTGVVRQPGGRWRALEESSSQELALIDASSGYGALGPEVELHGLKLILPDWFPPSEMHLVVTDNLLISVDWNAAGELIAEITADPGALVSGDESRLPMRQVLVDARDAIKRLLSTVTTGPKTLAELFPEPRFRIPPEALMVKAVPNPGHLPDIQRELRELGAPGPKNIYAALNVHWTYDAPLAAHYRVLKYIQGNIYPNTGGVQVLRDVLVAGMVYGTKVTADFAKARLPELDGYEGDLPVFAVDLLQADLAVQALRSHLSQVFVELYGLLADHEPGGLLAKNYAAVLGREAVAARFAALAPEAQEFLTENAQRIGLAFGTVIGTMLGKPREQDPSSFLKLSLWNDKLRRHKGIPELADIGTIGDWVANALTGGGSVRPITQQRAFNVRTGFGRLGTNPDQHGRPRLDPPVARFEARAFGTLWGDDEDFERDALDLAREVKAAHEAVIEAHSLQGTPAGAAILAGQRSLIAQMMGVASAKDPLLPRLGRALELVRRALVLNQPLTQARQLSDIGGEIGRWLAVLQGDDGSSRGGRHQAGVSLVSSLDPLVRKLADWAGSEERAENVAGAEFVAGTEFVAAIDAVVTFEDVMDRAAKRVPSRVTVDVDETGRRPTLSQDMERRLSDFAKSVAVAARRGPVTVEIEGGSAARTFLRSKAVKIGERRAELVAAALKQQLPAIARREGLDIDPDRITYTTSTRGSSPLVAGVRGSDPVLLSFTRGDRRVPTAIRQLSRMLLPAGTADGSEALAAVADAMMSQGADAAIAEASRLSGPRMTAGLLTVLVDRVVEENARSGEDRGDAYVLLTQLDAALGTHLVSAGGAAGLSPIWERTESPVPSWARVEQALTSLGAGGMALVMSENGGGTTVVAARCTPEGIRWIDMSAPLGRRVTGSAPAMPVAGARAYFIDPADREVAFPPIEPAAEPGKSFKVPDSEALRPFGSVADVVGLSGSGQGTPFTFGKRDKWRALGRPTSGAGAPSTSTAPQPAAVTAPAAVNGLDRAKDEGAQLAEGVDAQALRDAVRALLPEDFAETVSESLSDEKVRRGWHAALAGSWRAVSKAGVEVSVKVVSVSPLDEDKKVEGNVKAADVPAITVDAEKSQTKTSKDAKKLNLSLDAGYVGVDLEVQGLGVGRSSMRSASFEQRRSARFDDAETHGWRGDHVVEFEVTVQQPRKPHAKWPGRAVGVAPSTDRVTMSAALEWPDRVPRSDAQDAQFGYPDVQGDAVAAEQAFNRVERQVQLILGARLISGADELRTVLEGVAAGESSGTGPLMDKFTGLDEESARRLFRGESVSGKAGDNRVRIYLRAPGGEAGKRLSSTVVASARTTVQVTTEARAGFETSEGDKHIAGGKLAVKSGKALAVAHAGVAGELSAERGDEVWGGGDWSWSVTDTRQVSDDTHRVPAELVVFDEHAGTTRGIEVVFEVRMETRSDESSSDGGRTTPPGLETERAPHSVHAEFHLSAAAVDEFVGPVAAKLSAGGGGKTRTPALVGGDQVHDFAEDLKRFVHDHAGDLVKGAEIPFSFEFPEGRQLVLRGSMGAGSYRRPLGEREVESVLATGATRMAARTHGRQWSLTAKGGATAAGAADLTGQAGYSAKRSVTASMAASWQAQKVWKLSVQWHLFRYPVGLEAFLQSEDGTRSPVFELQADSSEPSSRVVEVSVPDRPGMALGDGDDGGPLRRMAGVSWQAVIDRRDMPAGPQAPRERGLELRAALNVQAAGLPARWAPEFMVLIGDLQDQAGRLLSELTTEAISKADIDHAAQSTRAMLADPALKNLGRSGWQQAAFGRAVNGGQPLAVRGVYQGHRHHLYVVDGEMTWHVVLENARVQMRDDAHVFTRVDKEQTTLPSHQESDHGVDLSLTAEPAQEITLLAGLAKPSAQVKAGIHQSVTRDAKRSVSGQTTHSYTARGYLITYDAVTVLDASGAFAARGKPVPQGAATAARFRKVFDAYSVWVEAADLPDVGLDSTQLDKVLPEDRAAYALDPQAGQLLPKARGVPARPSAPAVPMGAFEVHRMSALAALVDVVDGQLAGLAKAAVQDKRLGLAADFEQLRRLAVRAFEQRLEPAEFGQAIGDALNGGLPLLVTMTDEQAGEREALVVVHAGAIGGKYVDALSSYESKSSYQVVRAGGVVTGTALTAQAMAGLAPEAAGLNTVVAEAVEPVGAVEDAITSGPKLVSEAVTAAGGWAADGVGEKVAAMVSPQATVQASYRRDQTQKDHEQTSVEMNRTEPALRFEYGLTVSTELFPWAEPGMYRGAFDRIAAHVRGGESRNSIKGVGLSPEKMVPSVLRSTVYQADYQAAAAALAVPSTTPALRQHGVSVPHDAVFEVSPFPAPELHGKLSDLVRGTLGAAGSWADEVNAFAAATLLTATTASQLKRVFPEALGPGGYSVSVYDEHLGAVKIEFDLSNLVAYKALPAPSATQAPGGTPAPSAKRSVRQTGSVPRHLESELMGSASAAVSEDGPKTVVTGTHEAGKVPEEQPPAAADQNGDRSLYLVRGTLHWKVIAEPAGGARGQVRTFTSGPNGDGSVQMVLDGEAMAALGVEPPPPELVSAAITNNGRGFGRSFLSAADLATLQEHFGHYDDARGNVMHLVKAADGGTWQIDRFSAVPWDVRDSFYTAQVHIDGDGKISVDEVNTGRRAMDPAEFGRGVLARRPSLVGRPAGTQIILAGCRGAAVPPGPDRIAPAQAVADATGRVVWAATSEIVPLKGGSSNYALLRDADGNPGRLVAFHPRGTTQHAVAVPSTDVAAQAAAALQAQAPVTRPAGASGVTAPTVDDVVTNPGTGDLFTLGGDSYGGDSHGEWSDSGDELEHDPDFQQFRNVAAGASVTRGAASDGLGVGNADLRLTDLAANAVIDDFYADYHLGEAGYFGSADGAGGEEEPIFDGSVEPSLLAEGQQTGAGISSPAEQAPYFDAETHDLDETIRAAAQLVVARDVGAGVYRPAIMNLIRWHDGRIDAEKVLELAGHPENAIESQSVYKRFRGTPGVTRRIVPAQDRAEGSFERVYHVDSAAASSAAGPAAIRAAARVAVARDSSRSDYRAAIRTLIDWHEGEITLREVLELAGNPSSAMTGRSLYRRFRGTPGVGERRVVAEGKQFELVYFDVPVGTVPAAGPARPRDEDVSGGPRFDVEMGDVPAAIEEAARVAVARDSGSDDFRAAIRTLINWHEGGITVREVLELAGDLSGAMTVDALRRRFRGTPGVSQRWVEAEGKRFELVYYGDPAVSVAQEPQTRGEVSSQAEHSPRSDVEMRDAPATIRVAAQAAVTSGSRPGVFRAAIRTLINWHGGEITVREVLQLAGDTSGTIAVKSLRRRFRDTPGVSQRWLEADGKRLGLVYYDDSVKTFSAAGPARSGHDARGVAGRSPVGSAVAASPVALSASGDDVSISDVSDEPAPLAEGSVETVESAVVSVVQEPQTGGEISSRAEHSPRSDSPRSDVEMHDVPATTTEAARVAVTPAVPRDEPREWFDSDDGLEHDADFRQFRDMAAGVSGTRGAGSDELFVGDDDPWLTDLAADAEIDDFYGRADADYQLGGEGYFGTVDGSEAEEPIFDAPVELSPLAEGQQTGGEVSSQAEQSPRSDVEMRDVPAAIAEAARVVVTRGSRRDEFRDAIRTLINWHGGEITASKVLELAGNPSGMITVDSVLARFRGTPGVGQRRVDAEGKLFEVAYYDNSVKPFSAAGPAQSRADEAARVPEEHHGGDAFQLPEPRVTHTPDNPLTMEEIAADMRWRLENAPHGWKVPGGLRGLSGAYGGNNTAYRAAKLLGSEGILRIRNRVPTTVIDRNPAPDLAAFLARRSSVLLRERFQGLPPGFQADVADIANEHGVLPATVLRAFEILRADGWLITSTAPDSGHYVVQGYRGGGLAAEQDTDAPEPVADVYQVNLARVDDKAIEAANAEVMADVLSGKLAALAEEKEEIIKGLGHLVSDDAVSVDSAAVSSWGGSTLVPSTASADLADSETTVVDLGSGSEPMLDGDGVPGQLSHPIDDLLSSLLDPTSVETHVLDGIDDRLAAYPPLSAEAGPAAETVFEPDPGPRMGSIEGRLAVDERLAVEGHMAAVPGRRLPIAPVMTDYRFNLIDAAAAVPELLDELRAVSTAPADSTIKGIAAAVAAHIGQAIRQGRPGHVQLTLEVPPDDLALSGLGLATAVSATLRTRVLLAIGDSAPIAELCPPGTTGSSGIGAR